MPMYEFRCAKCGSRFTVRQSFRQHDRNDKPKCPECASKSVDREINDVHVQTARKS